MQYVVNNLAAFLTIMFPLHGQKYRYFMFPRKENIVSSDHIQHKFFSISKLD